MKTSIALAIILSLAALGTALLYHPFVSSTGGPAFGAAAGPDFYNQAAFYAGRVDKTQVATTSMGAAVTVTANEFTGWANAGAVSFTQGLPAASTLTFPASSTIANVVPNAGDRQTFCIRNATTTAALTTILAGSTGVNLLTASSSVSAVGSTKLTTGKVGCITLVRQAKTSTTFDIDALLTTFL